MKARIDPQLQVRDVFSSLNYCYVQFAKGHSFCYTPSWPYFVKTLIWTLHSSKDMIQQLTWSLIDVHGHEAGPHAQIMLKENSIILPKGSDRYRT